MSRPTLRGRVRIPLLGVVLLALAPGVAGCAATIAEVPSRADASEPFATFALENGFASLPRAEVLLGGAGDADAVLRVDVVVADTPEDRARGLMGVAAVPDGAGMLFAFPDATGPGRPGFWMLDTRVPLDIVFAADGVVVGVATMQPCAAAPCPVTHPGVDYDVALEVAAGVLEAVGIAAGDRFVLRIDEPSSEDAR